MPGQLLKSQLLLMIVDVGQSLLILVDVSCCHSKLVSVGQSMLLSVSVDVF